MFNCPECKTLLAEPLDQVDTTYKPSRGSPPFHMYFSGEKPVIAVCTKCLVEYYKKNKQLSIIEIIHSL